MGKRRRREAASVLPVVFSCVGLGGAVNKKRKSRRRGMMS
jgi:hypothetical protein